MILGLFPKSWWVGVQIPKYCFFFTPSLETFLDLYPLNVCELANVCQMCSVQFSCCCSTVMIEILPLPACLPCFRHPGCHPCGQGGGGGGGGVVVTLHDAGCNKSSLGMASQKNRFF